MGLKLYAYAAVAVIVAGLFIHDRWMAKRYEHQKAANAVLVAEKAALEIAAKKDTRIADELATFRTQQTISLRQFDETLRTSKVTREIRYENGTCVVRDPALYRRLFNEANSPSTSP
jgi:hypothetical protein